MNSPGEGEMNKDGGNSKGRRASTQSWRVSLLPAVSRRCRTIEYMGIRSKQCPGCMLIEMDGNAAKGWKAVESTADFIYAKRSYVQVFSTRGNREHGIIEDYNCDCCFTYVVNLRGGKTVYVPENYIFIDGDAAGHAEKLPYKKRMTSRVILK